MSLADVVPDWPRLNHVEVAMVQLSFALFHVAICLRECSSSLNLPLVGSSFLYVMDVLDDVLCASIKSLSLPSSLHLSVDFYLIVFGGFCVLAQSQVDSGEFHSETV